MIEFDEMKDAANLRKHGLPLETAGLLFQETFIEEEDRRRDYAEAIASSS